MTIEEYISNGGSITRLPPGTAMYGYSPQQRDAALAPTSLVGMSYAEGMKQFFDAQKSAAREKAYIASQRKGSRKANEAKQSKAVERRRLMAEQLASGMTIEAIAASQGITVKHARQLIGEAKAGLVRGRKG